MKVKELNTIFKDMLQKEINFIDNALDTLSEDK